MSSKGTYYSPFHLTSPAEGGDKSALGLPQPRLVPQTPNQKETDPTPSTPQILLALWVLNPAVFHPYLLLGWQTQRSPSTWLRLEAGDSGSSFHPLHLASGPTSRISSGMNALFSRNSRRHLSHLPQLASRLPPSSTALPSQPA